MYELNILTNGRTNSAFYNCTAIYKMILKIIFNIKTYQINI